MHSLTLTARACHRLHVLTHPKVAHMQAQAVGTDAAAVGLCKGCEIKHCECVCRASTYALAACQLARQTGVWPISPPQGMHSRFSVAQACPADLSQPLDVKGTPVMHCLEFDSLAAVYLASQHCGSSGGSQVEGERAPLLLVARFSLSSI
jgi:hypothetical protein